MRIAHLSDLHLLALDGAHPLDFANKRWLGGVNLLLRRGRHHRAEILDALIADLGAEGVDHAVCTGDVTNLALDSEFRLVRARFDRIALGPERVTCIPGNHDAYVATPAGSFESVLADYCSADDGWRWDGGGRWPIVRVRGDLAVVGLSTGHPTAWLMAYGSVGQEQLLRLEHALGDARVAGKCRVILIHHPPCGKGARSFLRGLHDHAAFARVLARQGAELVLFGHEHADVRETLPGPGGARIAVNGVSSATYTGEDDAHRARYRIYTIEPAAEGGRARVVGERTRVWMPDERRFG